MGVQHLSESLIPIHLAEVGLLDHEVNLCVIGESPTVFLSGYPANYAQWFNSPAPSPVFTFCFVFFFNNGHINGCKVALICISLEMATHSSQRSYLEDPRDRGSLVGCCLWGRTESDPTEATQQQQQHWQAVSLPPAPPGKPLVLNRPKQVLCPIPISVV